MAMCCCERRPARLLGVGLRRGQRKSSLEGIMQNSVLIPSLFVTMLAAPCVGVFAMNFGLEVRESQDSYRSVKKYSIQDNHKLKIDLNKIGWRHCEISRVEQVAQVVCWIDANRTISGSCHGVVGEKNFEILLQGNGQGISLELACDRR